MSVARAAAEQKAFTRKAASLAAAVCLGITAASYFAGVRPALGQYAQLLIDQSSLKDRRNDAMKNSSELGLVRRRLQGTQQELERLPLRLEPASAVNGRLHRLTSVAASAGVTVEQLHPQPAVNGQYYQTVPILLSGSGSYPACARFLHELRERFPDTSVRSFDLQNTLGGLGDGTTSPTGNATFRMDLAWHTSLDSR